MDLDKKSMNRIQYQKIINLLDTTTSQPSKFRAKNWVEINDDAHGPMQI